MYPGEDWCDPSADAPHAKWHLETGIGLADWAHLADLYYQVGTSIIFVQFRYSFVTVSFSRSYLRQMNKQMILQKKKPLKDGSSTFGPINTIFSIHYLLSLRGK